MESTEFLGDPDGRSEKSTSIRVSMTIRYIQKCALVLQQQFLSLLYLRNKQKGSCTISELQFIAKVFFATNHVPLCNANFSSPASIVLIFGIENHTKYEMRLSTSYAKARILFVTLKTHCILNLCCSSMIRRTFLKILIKSISFALECISRHHKVVT